METISAAVKLFEQSEKFSVRALYGAIKDAASATSLKNHFMMLFRAHVYIWSVKHCKSSF